MIFKDIIDYFEIKGSFPEYLLDESFNDVFLEGEVTKNDNAYKIEVTTRQNVTHMMFINPEDDFPVIIMSELPNGLLNGMKFGQIKGQEIPINKL